MSPALQEIAAYGLPTRHVLPASPAQGWPTGGVGECEHHRLIGFLGGAVRDGALDLDDDTRAEVEACWQAWLAHAVRAERTLLRAVDTLEAEGIEARVLKGAALAHTSYPQPELRVFGDVDLLVRSPDFGAAVGVLERAFGTDRVEPELRPGFDERFGKEALLRPPGSPELDVHRTLVAGALGLTVDLDDLFDSPTSFRVGGKELFALGAAQRLLHACYAAVLGDWPPRLGSLRDVAQLTLTRPPDLDELRDMTRRWRCEAVLAEAVTKAWSELRIAAESPVHRWAVAHRPSLGDRVLLGSHQGPGRAVTRHLAALAVIPGVRDRGAYLRAVAFPQPAYLRARSTTGAARVRRLLGQVHRS